MVHCLIISPCSLSISWAVSEGAWKLPALVTMCYCTHNQGRCSPSPLSGLKGMEGTLWTGRANKDQKGRHTHQLQGGSQGRGPAWVADCQETRAPVVNSQLRGSSDNLLGACQSPVLMGSSTLCSKETLLLVPTPRSFWVVLEVSGKI